LLTRSDDYGEIRYEKETKCVEEVEVEVSRSFWIEAWQARLRMRRFTNDTTL
jgi:hypothetical protein